VSGFGGVAHFEDPEGKFAAWCLNQDLLVRAGLYMENPKWTLRELPQGYRGWVHLDTKPRKNRIFIPNSSKPTAPNFMSLVF